MSGASSAGAGCFTYKVSRLWASWKWGHWDDDVGDDSVVPACRGFCSVPGPLQTVQRAELWGVILALQANDGVHLGFDSLGVVRHVGKMLDGQVSSRPRELLQDGDLLLLIERMLHIRGLSAVRICEVKGHADEALVRAGTVRDLDRLGKNGADEAADFGRRRVPWWVIDARAKFLVFALGGVLLLFPCIVSLLPSLGLSLIMLVVLVPLLILWFGLLVVLLRGVGLRCRIGLFCLDWLIFGLVGVAATPDTCRDIEVWPYSVGLLVKWVAFLGTLHWPEVECNLGVGGVSYVELLILYELWAGERLKLEKAVPRFVEQGANFSVAAFWSRH